MSNSNVYLASKPRYEILDGLRGVAAMLVVAYHLLETYYGGKPDQPINHGYLAVDFFFVLSGFVIGYAYDDRWEKPQPLSPSPKGEGGQFTLWSFFKRRLIRLHPMVIFGTLFGALMFYFGSCGEFPLINQTPWYMVLLVMFWCFTMIPLPNTYQRLGRDQSAERPRMVAAMGVYRQYPLCTHYPQVVEGGTRYLCGHLCRPDHHPLPEHRRNGIPGGAQLGSIYRRRRLVCYARPASGWSYPPALSLLLRTAYLARG